MGAWPLAAVSVCLCTFPLSKFDYELLTLLCCPSASKFMIDTGAGVIDSDYRGTVFVLLFNYSDSDFEGELSSLFLWALVLILARSFGG